MVSKNQVFCPLLNFVCVVHEKLLRIIHYLNQCFGITYTPNDITLRCDLIFTESKRKNI